MNSQPAPTAARQIVWPSVVTVISAAILIGAEVFGAAFAGGWALAILFGLDDTGAHILQAVLFAIGVFVMIAFIRAAQRVEPFSAAEPERGELRIRASMPANLQHSLKKLNVCSHSAMLVHAVREKIVRSAKKMLRSRVKTLICTFAQFRTCLWSCVSR